MNASEQPALRRKLSRREMVKFLEKKTPPTIAGMCRIEPLLERIAADQSLPEPARELFAMHGEEYRELLAQTKAIDEELMKLHRADECSKRLVEIPGVGPIGASLLLMKTPDSRMFKSGRDFAAWIGLTPTAGKVRLGVITVMG